MYCKTFSETLFCFNLIWLFTCEQWQTEICFIHNSSNFPVWKFQITRTETLKFIPCNTGNSIGDEGLEEVKNWLNENGQLDILGSMSEDEGEGDDDDDDNDDDDQEDELEGGDSEGDEGDVSNDLNLSVTGVSLKPQSPLLGDDEEVENELIKVCLLCNSVVLLVSFAFFQSLDCQQNFTKIKLFSKKLPV